MQYINFKYMSEKYNTQKRMPAKDTSIIIHGFHSVESAMINDVKGVKEIWINIERKDKRVQKIINLAKTRAIKITPAKKEYLDKKADTDRHQGVIARFESTKSYTELYLPEILKKESVFLLVLDTIEDPHNLGACLRSANAAGVDAVIIPKNKAVGLTATVRKIASGAAESTPLIQVGNLTEILKKLQEAQVWCVGTAGETDTTLYETDLTGRLAIVMGNEQKGLRKLTRENCDTVVKIPMNGDVESLNISVATGITLFEALRQRTIKK